MHPSPVIIIRWYTIPSHRGSWHCFTHIDLLTTHKLMINQYAWMMITIMITIKPMISQEFLHYPHFKGTILSIPWKKMMKSTMTFQAMGLWILAALSWAARWAMAIEATGIRGSSWLNVGPKMATLWQKYETHMEHFNTFHIIWNSYKHLGQKVNYTSVLWKMDDNL